MGWDWLYNPVAIPRDLAKGAGDLISGGSDKGSGQAPSPAPLPEAPKPEASAAKAEETVKKRRAAMIQTTFTDPLGVSGQANIVKKSLTGQ